MNFKATVFGAAASVLAFGAATAADLPSYKAPPPPPPAIGFDWSGYHVGVTGSYGGGSANYLSNVYSLGVPFVAFSSLPSSSGTSGFLVGVESGATWQLPNNFVIGYESEFNYADVRSNIGGSGFGLNSRLRWFGAERLRFGYAFGRFLPYITGGLAYGQLHANGVDAVGGFLFPTSASNWQAGWTVGAGLEYALLDKVSVKAEYLYSSLQGVHGAGVGFPNNSFRIFTGNGFDTHIARIGINYHVKNLGALIGMPELGI
ncbi:MAG: outer membrane protein [Methylocystis sp.]|jgi:outer membrane immunogenic protein